VILRVSLAVLLATTLTAATFGCGGQSSTVSSGTPSVAVTEAASPDASGEAADETTPAAGSAAGSVDALGVGAELDAMEKELDQMDMPSDIDFSDAEGALY
jgi:hypothetical protein